MTRVQFLPGTGRWQPEGLTEGLLMHPRISTSPSTTPLRGAVPLPGTGRNA
jgi:hypothetical protein